MLPKPATILYTASFQDGVIVHLSIDEILRRQHFTGDTNILHQILANIGANAAKYTDIGFIELRASVK